MESQEKKLSIVIPCYNSSKYLKECMDSLIGQSMGMDELEIVLVDDASTDETVTLLEQYREQYPKSVKVLALPENCRQGGARNAGIRIATGEYVMFLDSDDWAEPKMCEKLCRIMEQEEPEIIQFAHYDMYPEGAEFIDSCKIPGVLQLADVETRKLFLQAEVLTCGSQTKCYKRSFLLEQHARFLEHVIFEEPSFVYPLLFAVKKIYCTSDIVYYLRIHPESTMQCEAFHPGRILNHVKVQMDAYEQVREKWWNLYGDEIEAYTLRTLYFETLWMSGTGRVELPVAEVDKIKQYCREQFQNWRNNPWIVQEDFSRIREVLETMDESWSQAEQNAYCIRLVSEGGIG